MKVLERTEFGNPVLRKKAAKVSAKDISSKRIQDLISDMHHTLVSKKLGIGLAAPQVGQSIALAVISIRPTSLRPKVTKFDLVIINPLIIKTGDKKEMWEGCISSGSGKAGLFAKVPRYKKITVKYYDENGETQEKSFTGLKAQVIQHEVDHLNGVLFVDHVEDTKTYMTYAEYKKRIAKKNKK